MNTLIELVLTAGLIAIVAGIILMLALSLVLLPGRSNCLPRECERSFSVQAMPHILCHRMGNTWKYDSLSIRFASMRDRIHQANSALLEAERLATIGRDGKLRVARHSPLSRNGIRKFRVSCQRAKIVASGTR